MDCDENKNDNNESMDFDGNKNHNNESMDCDENKNHNKNHNNSVDCDENINDEKTFQRHHDCDNMNINNDDDYQPLIIMDNPRGNNWAELQSELQTCWQIKKVC